MNIFPNRKSSLNYFKKEFKNDFEDYKNKCIQFPSEDVYKKLNEQLLQNYLHINKKIKIENNIVNKVNTIEQKKDNQKIYNLNLSVNFNNHIYDLFIYHITTDISLKEHLDYIYKNNYNLIFEIENNNIQLINNEKKISSIKLSEIVKNIFKKTKEKMLIPNYCNLWIFGNQGSIIIQGTYIPMEEGSYTDNDYLDLINNYIEKSYLNFDKDEIYNNINISKQNENLFFLIFK